MYMCFSQFISLEFQDDKTRNSNFLFFTTLNVGVLSGSGIFMQHTIVAYLMLCHLSLLTDKIMVPGSIIINDLIIVLKCDSCLHLLASNLGFDVYSIFIGEDSLMRLNLRRESMTR